MIRYERDLAFTRPLHPDNLFGHLVATAVPGVEEWRAGAYRVAVRLPAGPAVLELSPGGPIRGGLWLSDPADLERAVSMARFVLDLDADPAAIDAVLAADPVLAPLVAAAPGRRVPRIADGEQFAIRAVLGQQVSTAAARTHAGRLVTAYGEPLDDPAGGLTHLFPTAERLAAMAPADLAMPGSRRRTVLGLARALADGLDLSEIGELPGIGPWTVASVAMRALGDSDAWLPTDLGVLKAATALGLPQTPRGLTAYAERWRPYRAYAVQHLWASGEHPVNRMPGAGPPGYRGGPALTPAETLRADGCGRRRAPGGAGWLDRGRVGAAG